MPRPWLWSSQWLHIGILKNKVMVVPAIELLLTKANAMAWKYHTLSYPVFHYLILSYHTTTTDAVLDYISITQSLSLTFLFVTSLVMLLILLETPLQFCHPTLCRMMVPHDELECRPLSKELPRVRRLNKTAKRLNKTKRNLQNRSRKRPHGAYGPSVSTTGLASILSTCCPCSTVPSCSWLQTVLH